MKCILKLLVSAAVLVGFNCNAMDYLFGNPINTKVKECVTELLSPENIANVLPPKSIKAILDSDELINMLVTKVEETAKKHPLILNNAQALLINKNYDLAKKTGDTKRMGAMEDKAKDLLGKQTTYSYTQLLELEKKVLSKSDREKLMSIFFGITLVLEERKSMRDLFYMVSDEELGLIGTEKKENGDYDTDNDISKDE